MLFTELASFAYTCNLLLSKGQESDDDSFDLHAFHLLEIDVADPFDERDVVLASTEGFCFG